MANPINPLMQIIENARKAGLRAYHGTAYDMPPSQRYLDKKTGKTYVAELDNPLHQRIVSDTDRYEPVGEPSELGLFDANRIGTGEGQQSYGRGLYFTESEDVARGYRDAVSKLRTSNRPEEGSIADSYEAEYGFSAFKPDHLTSFDDVVETFKDDAVEITSDLRGNTRYEFSDGSGFLTTPDEKIVPVGETRGRMYEVNIDAGSDELLDWDELLDEQPKAVLDRLKATDWWQYAEEGAGDRAGMRGENPTGADLLRWLEEDGAEEAAEALQNAGIKGVKYADAFTRHKAKDKRSNNYVVFDPAIIEISRKYGISIPLAGAVLAGTMTPEEAQAAGGMSGIRSLAKQIEYDPRFDPRKKEVEGLQSLTVDVLPRNDVMVKPPLKLSDLEGESFVTSMSDRTAAGGMVMGINDVPLFRAVDLRGGQDFMFENPNQVWASAKVPSQDILNLGRQLKKDTGRDPLFIPWRMAPTGGDFSTTVGELMLGFASSNMNKTTKKALDRAIKKFKTVGTIDQKTGQRKNAGRSIEEWPGVDDPRAVEIWRATPDPVRKELMNMMDVEFRAKGGLSIGAARIAATDPGQLVARDAGIQNVGRIFADQEITPSTHPSYPFAVPGGGVGVLKNADEATIFDLLPEARFGAAQKPVKDPAKPTAQEIRALQMKAYSGTITENILRRMEERGVDVNSLAGMTPAALGFTLTTAGLITPEEASAGGLDIAADAFGTTKSKEEPGLAGLYGELALGAGTEIAGAIGGGMAGMLEYLRGAYSPRPATAESIKSAREGIGGLIGGVYDAGPEAQELGQEIMQNVGETVAPFIDYALEGPIMDEQGLNLVPLIAQKLGIPAYQVLEYMYNQLPRREQEAVISAGDALL